MAAIDEDHAVMRFERRVDIEEWRKIACRPPPHMSFTYPSLHQILSPLLEPHIFLFSYLPRPSPRFS